MGAWIDGRPAERQEAVRAAAGILGRSRLPLIAGLTADAAAIRASLALAQRARGVADHRDSGALGSLVSVLQDAGLFLGAPAEIRRRADLLLAFGPDAFAAAPETTRFLLSAAPDLGPAAGRGRRIVWIGPPDETPDFGALPVEGYPCPPDRLGEAAGTIRAALGGRRFGAGPLAEGAADRIARSLAEAAFGCALLVPTRLDALDVETIGGLVADLNVATRFTTLPLLPAGQGMGAHQIALAATGFPLPVSFGTGNAEHDPRFFAGARLLASGEADALLLVSTLEREAAPVRETGVPTIVLSPEEEPPAGAHVCFRVASTGEAGGALHDPLFGSFVPVEAQGPGGRAEAAAILSEIAERLEPPC